jgi:phospholipid transport system transporter-binding protein
MSQQLSWSREGETLALSGELDQDLLNPLWDKRHEAMQGVTLIDLSDVTRVDTAGVALLVHLLPWGKSRDKRHFTGASDNVVTLRSSTIPDVCLVNIFSALLPKALTVSSSGLFACLRQRHFALRCWACFHYQMIKSPWKIMKSRQC